VNERLVYVILIATLIALAAVQFVRQSECPVVTWDSIPQCER